VLEVKSVGKGLKFDFVTRINAFCLAGHVENGCLQRPGSLWIQDASRKRKQSETAIGFGH
jgi:hypothetical protein